MITPEKGIGGMRPSICPLATYLFTSLTIDVLRALPLLATGPRRAIRVRVFATLTALRRKVRIVSLFHLS